MRQIFRFLILLILTTGVKAQTNFSIVVEPYAISGLPGLHSFAAAEYGGKWVIIGGRTDGLHQRQAPFSFLSAGNNTNIYIVDPVTKHVWSATVNNLSASLKEQLQSTNMCFTGDGPNMYITGGYGYSATLGNHKTYASLIVVDLPGLINSIMNNASISPYFRQLNNPLFAITGGHMVKLGSMFLLVGGQKFDGRYNANNGPSFTQEYSNQIRKFRIADDGVNLNISYQTNITDANELHRRDYNLTPQVFPDGRLGFTAFSGVFQYGANIPFLNTVDMDTVGYTPKFGFNQLLNHYHSGQLGIYDSVSNIMHNIFFGGMAQYYFDAGGNLIQDNEVPFVSTIAKVTRSSNGSMTETKIGDLPGLTGSGSELILNPNLPLYPHDVIKLNQLVQDTVLVGYLVGGIESSAPNIFNFNTGTQSSASNTVYKVLLVKATILPVKLLFFKGYTQKDGILLEWSTASESDLNRFELERSSDGRTFHSIRKISSNQDSHIEKNYTYKDMVPEEGINYYRLKSISKDGSETFYPIISIRYGKMDHDFLMYPNPVNEKLVIEFDKPLSGVVTLKIFDVKGMQLVRDEKSIASRQIFINTGGLPTGSYFIEMEIHNQRFTRKFTKN